VSNSGGGYADFFRGQREKDDKGGAGQGGGGGGAGGSWGDEDTGVDYISEKDFNTRLEDLESQHEMKELLRDSYGDYVSAQVYTDESRPIYEEGYRKNSSNVVELEKQIEALKGQRALSQKVDDVGKRSYDTEEAAAQAFADPAVTGTGNDHLERAAVIIHEQVPTIDQSGNIVMQSKYVLKDTFVGSHDNVISGVLSSYLDSISDLAQGDSISFVHTHPYCTGHVPNKFSGEEGATLWDILNYSAAEAISGGDFNEFAEYLGDRQVAWLPGVERIYLASPTEKALYACDKNGPILDPNDPKQYKVLGNFSSKITKQYQE
jgi:hypothetical protein